jgi:predicted transcriptional regulator
MIAKSLDIVVLLKLWLDNKKRSYSDLSKELLMSASAIHAAVRRGIEAGLIDPTSRLRPMLRPLFPRKLALTICRRSGRTRRAR